MRVLQLISSIGFYGAEKMILELSRGLARSGHEVLIANLASRAAGRGKLRERSRALGVECLELPCRGRLDLHAVMKIRRLIGNDGIGVVHSHGYKANFYAYLAGTAMPVKLIATCHNWPGKGLKMRYYRWLDKVILKGIDRIAAVSRPLAEEISLAGIPAGRLKVIRNGIEPRKADAGARQELRRSLGIATDVRIIGTLGRLSPEKGYQVLLDGLPEVFSRFPSAVCVLAGDGPQRADLERQAKERGIGERVRFAGNRDDTEEMLALYDVYVQPSLTEGLPMALLEAMSAGKPVIATAVGEVPAVVTPGTGVLVEPGDAGALSRAVLSLLSDAPACRRMADAAAERIRKEFSLRKMTEEYVGLYGESMRY